MSTVIRVKRHFTEDPVEALVLACKRRKTVETGDEDDYSTLLKFTGTVPEKDDQITAQTIEKLNRTANPKDLFKTSSTIEEIMNKSRKDRKTQSENSRFKVISCFRAERASATQDGESSQEKEDKKQITIVDVDHSVDESNKTCGENDTYVYDLYCSNLENDTEMDDILIDNFLSVHAVQSSMLEFRSGEDSHDEYDCDDDDSNDESNWRNDYPDSDHSITEDNMKIMAGLRGMCLDDGYDLSSDTGEEDYLNLDEDELLFGTRYSKYKTRVLEEFDDDEGEMEDSADDNY